MPGSYWKQKDRYIVGWWDGKTQHKITRYEGMPMRHKSYAEQLLAEMRGEWRNHQRGLCAFRIEKWTGKAFTDVIEYFEAWLKTKEKKKPATIKGYRSYFKCWIKPFFKKYPVMLHEVQLDILDKLLDFIKLTGKGKMNVMMCFHSFMDYAWRSRRIPEMPPFPKKEEYNIVEPTIKWLQEERQMAIINAIPEEHRSIFLWLKYHLRRPSEACALKWEDYDEINSIFIIRRSVSARKIVGSTKTSSEHVTPCHSAYKPIMGTLRRNIGGFIFTNPRAREKGKRYTSESLNTIWKSACRDVGETIDLYSGLKHSSCSQYINEKGLSLSELQIITDHKRLDSVRKYAKVEVSRKRALMERVSTKFYQKRNIAMPEDKSGFIYILSNPCFPYLKIGCTKNDPIDRCYALSLSQAIPKPFNIEYSARVEDKFKAETGIHHHFKDRKIGKEFYNISLKDAKNIIENLYNGIEYEEYIIDKLKRAAKQINALRFCS